MGFLSQKEAPAVTSTEAQLELEQTAALSIQSAEENMPVTPTDTPPVASYQEAAGAGEAQQETSVGGQATSTPLEDEAPALDASKEEDRRTGIFIFPASATGKTKEGQPNWAEMPNPKPATESEIEDAIDDDSKVIVFSMAMKPPTGDLAKCLGVEEVTSIEIVQEQSTKSEKTGTEQGGAESEKTPADPEKMEVDPDPAPTCKFRSSDIRLRQGGAASATAPNRDENQDPGPAEETGAGAEKPAAQEKPEDTSTEKLEEGFDTKLSLSDDDLLIPTGDTADLDRAEKDGILEDAALKKAEEDLLDGKEGGSKG